MRDWQQYYQATQNKPPSALLIRALDFCADKETALDLGAGALTDSKFLLDQGFQVVAVDSSPLMLEAAKSMQNDRLTAIQSDFASYEFPPEYFDLINAEWSLPFNPPGSFNEMFSRLKNSLKPGGIFVGQFFGERDEWNVPGKKMTFHSEHDVRDLLADFEIIELIEEDKDGSTAVGGSKHWNVFHAITRKPTI